MVKNSLQEFPPEIRNNLIICPIEADIIYELREINIEIDNILLAHLRDNIDRIMHHLKVQIEQNPEKDFSTLIRQLKKVLIAEIENLLNR